MFGKTLFLPALRTSSLLLLPFVVACASPGTSPGDVPGTDPPARDRDPVPIDPQPMQCVEQASTLAFVETFNEPIAGWSTRTGEPAAAGHSWTLVRTPGQGQLVSDPAGASLASYENQITTPAFSLKEATRGYVRFMTRFQQSGTFEVLMSDASGRRSTIATFGAQNPSWPNLDCAEIPIPKEFSGQDGVRVSLRVVGGEGGGEGSVVDNLRVSVRSCAPGTLPEGQAPPALKAHRQFSIGPCPPVGQEPPDEM